MEGVILCTQEWQAEKLEGYHSDKIPSPRSMGVLAPHRDPNPEQQKCKEEPAWHLVVKISGNSVLLGDPDATFSGTATLTVTAPVQGVYCLVPDCWQGN